MFMRIQVIHHEYNSFSIRIHNINKIFDFLRPVSCSTLFS